MQVRHQTSEPPKQLSTHKNKSCTCGTACHIIFSTRQLSSHPLQKKSVTAREAVLLIPAADFLNKYSGYSETGYFGLEWKPLVVMLVHKSTIRRMSELKSTYFVIGLPLNSWKGIHRLQFSDGRKKKYTIYQVSCSSYIRCGFFLH